MNVSLSLDASELAAVTVLPQHVRTSGATLIVLVKLPGSYMYATAVEARQIAEAWADVADVLTGGECGGPLVSRCDDCGTVHG